MTSSLHRLNFLFKWFFFVAQCSVHKYLSVNVEKSWIYVHCLSFLHKKRKNIFKLQICKNKLIKNILITLSIYYS